MSPLFTPPDYKWNLNPYAEIIVDEAIRRGVSVEVQDEELGYFTLSHGGRSIACRESFVRIDVGNRVQPLRMTSA